MRPVTANEVLIVGAGPTGLVLAIELARRSVPFRLIDRHKEPLGWDRAIFIKSRTMEILAGLGLAEAFLRRGQYVHSIELYTEQLKVAGYQFKHLDTPYPYILSLPEDETEAILTERLEALGGQIERGVEFVDLERHDSGVSAVLRDEDAGERQFQASWIVGTDGSHSAVRKAVGDSFDGHEYAQLWGVVDGRIAGWQHPRQTTCVQLRKPVVVPFPLGEDRWRIYFRADHPGSAILDVVGKRLAALSPGAQLQRTGDINFFHAQSRVAHQFRIGRVLVAGDAAHISNPIEGHGMNAGIQDAQNLGWKLAMVVSGQAPDALMDSYEAERRPVARAIVDSGDAAEARIFEASLESTREFIEFLSTPDGQDLAALAESELDFGYDKSPIVAEFTTDEPARPNVTKIGFRVGDVKGLAGVEGEFGLFDLIAAPKHTLFFLLDYANASVVAEALSQLGPVTATYGGFLRTYVVSRDLAGSGPLPQGALCDTTGRLHDRLALHGPTLCLVRPDGHLGFRCNPPSLDMLNDYLGKILGLKGCRG